VEAGNDDNSMLFNLEDFAVGEAPNSGTATVPSTQREIAMDVTRCIEQFRLLRRGETFYLASQVADMPTTLARFSLAGKL
jgi:hypothetical protein